MNTLSMNQVPEESLPPVRTVNLSFEVQEDNGWSELNITEVESVENASLAQIKATIYNDGDVNAIISSFDVRMYNSTWLEANYTYSFPDDITILPKVSRTQNLTFTIAFHNEEESYVFQAGFSYVLASNRSEDLFAGYTGNYTINMRLIRTPPPELLVLAFYFVTFLLITHIAIGFYGSRKEKIESKKPKYIR
jgi:hypothetical protein